MDQVSGNLFPYLTRLRTKFYRHNKNYQGVLSSLDALLKARNKPIKPEIYEYCMLAKIEAFCALHNYTEALELIDKEFPEADQIGDFEVLKWKCEAFLNLKKYDELEKTLAIMEKVDPENIIISSFRRRLTSAN
jgi:hypothetical protein